MTDLSPVKFEYDIHWKREDLFRIFDLNGSKARFIYGTLSRSRDVIREKFANTVYTQGRPGSHSCYTLSVCCQQLGLDFKADAESADKPYFKFIQRDSDVSRYIYDDVVAQVENIPRGLETIIIPCGSCQTLYALLLGLKKFENFPKQVLAVGNKPINPCITQLAADNKFPFRILFVNRRRCSYETTTPPFELDTVHELQAWSLLQGTSLKKYLTPESLFWVTANYNFLRREKNADC